MAIAAVPLRRKLILIVEDEVASRQTLADALRGRYDVVLAEDGVEGAIAAAQSPPDLILTDVMMPRLDGLAMVRQIREGLGLKVPVIFLTGHDRPTDVIAGINAGARHYMTKPVDLRDLRKRIARALG